MTEKTLYQNDDPPILVTDERVVVRGQTLAVQHIARVYTARTPSQPHLTRNMWLLIGAIAVVLLVTGATIVLAILVVFAVLLATGRLPRPHTGAPTAVDADHLVIEMASGTTVTLTELSTEQVEAALDAVSRAFSTRS